MRRRWSTMLLGIAIVGVVFLSVAVARPSLIGLSTASTTGGSCPSFMHPGWTYWVEYDSNTGKIESVVATSPGTSPNLTVPIDNITPASIQINASQAQTMMCAMYSDSNFPWTVDLTTHQVVP